MGIPIALLEYDSDYTFTGTYQHREFDLTLNNVKCNNGVLTDPSIQLTEVTPDETCTDLTVALTLAADEIAYWGAVSPVTTWSYISNETISNT